jgi:hypothetical protein
VHRSGIAHRAFQDARETGRPSESLGHPAEPDRLDAVLALLVSDLARTWTKQRSKLQPPSEEQHGETVDLSQHQAPAPLVERARSYLHVGD